MAIPFLAIEGYHTLLASRAGRFVEEPTRTEPGWRAFVEPTPIVGVAEIDRGVVTGVTLLIHHPEVRSAATVILVPGSLEIDGVTLDARPPVEAVAAVGAALRLAIDRIEMLDRQGWQEVFGSGQYSLDSPDPVNDEAGDPLFAVGPVTVDGSNAAAFLGRPADGAAPITVQFRRELFWAAVVADPPLGAAPFAADLRDLSGMEVQVLELPTSQLEPVPLIDSGEAEALIRDVVAYPAGSVPGDRLQVRILDRAGGAELEDIAAAVAALGMEVIEIGNAMPFDGGQTQIVVPVALFGDGDHQTLPPMVEELSRSVGIRSVIVDNDGIDDPVVTMVIAQDFDLANLH